MFFLPFNKEDAQLILSPVTNLFIQRNTEEQESSQELRKIAVIPDINSHVISTSPFLKVCVKDFDHIYLYKSLPDRSDELRNWRNNHSLQVWKNHDKFQKKIEIIEEKIETRLVKDETKGPVILFIIYDSENFEGISKLLENNQIPQNCKIRTIYIASNNLMQVYEEQFNWITDLETKKLAAEFDTSRYFIYKCFRIAQDLQGIQGIQGIQEVDDFINFAHECNFMFKTITVQTNAKQDSNFGLIPSATIYAKLELLESTLKEYKIQAEIIKSIMAQLLVLKAELKASFNILDNKASQELYAIDLLKCPTLHTYDEKRERDRTFRWIYDALKQLIIQANQKYEEDLKKPPVCPTLNPILNDLDSEQFGALSYEEKFFRLGNALNKEFENQKARHRGTATHSYQAQLYKEILDRYSTRIGRSIFQNSAETNERHKNDEMTYFLKKLIGLIENKKNNIQNIPKILQPIVERINQEEVFFGDKRIKSCFQNYISSIQKNPEAHQEDHHEFRELASEFQFQQLTTEIEIRHTEYRISQNKGIKTRDQLNEELKQIKNESVTYERKLRLMVGRLKWESDEKEKRHDTQFIHKVSRATLGKNLKESTQVRLYSELLSKYFTGDNVEECKKEYFIYINKMGEIYNPNYFLSKFREKLINCSYGEYSNILEVLLDKNPSRTNGFYILRILQYTINLLEHPNNHFNDNQELKRMAYEYLINQIKLSIYKNYDKKNQSRISNELKAVFIDLNADQYTPKDKFEILIGALLEDKQLQKDKTKKSKDSPWTASLKFSTKKEETMYDEIFKDISEDIFEQCKKAYGSYINSRELKKNTSSRTLGQ